MPGRNAGPHSRVIYRETTAASLAAGKLIRIPLDAGIPERIGGRWTHVRKVRLYGTLQYDAVGATMPAAMPGELIRCAFKNLKLVAGGHPLLDNVDGWDIEVDKAVRHGRGDGGLSDIADGDATDATVSFTVTIPLDSPVMASADPDDGLVPMGLFSSERHSEDVLSFEVASTVPNFAGVTFDGFTTLTAEVVYETLPYRRLPPTWRLFVVTSALLRNTIRPRGAIGHVTVNTREASSGDLTQGTIGNIDLAVGGEQLYAGQSVTEVSHGFAAMRNDGAYDEAFDSVDGDEAAPAILPLVAARLGTRRSRLPKGRVDVTFTAQTAGEDTRFLVFEHGGREKTIMDKWAQRLGFANADALPVRATGGGDVRHADLKVA